jgi:hypothetical protein
VAGPAGGRLVSLLLLVVLWLMRCSAQRAAWHASTRLSRRRNDWLMASVYEHQRDHLVTDAAKRIVKSTAP